MPHFYLASMQLTCEKGTEELQERFLERWTRRLERHWNEMAFSTDEEIEPFLNKKIWQACKEFIATDMDDSAVGVSALKAGEWISIPSGGYMQVAKIGVRSLVDAEARAWTMRDYSGQQATISIYATLDRIEN